ncbi:MAG: hypothetical protein ABIP53_07100 [Candidatus Limnocylindrales bacterium]
MALRGSPAHASATILLIMVIAACGGSTVPAGTGAPPVTRPTDPPQASTATFLPGGWQGTISFHAVVDADTTETSNSGDPGGVYFTTTTSHYTAHGDATDELAVTGTDDSESAVFGIGSVDLTGTASNQGMSLDRSIITSDKHNSLGCHYTDEVGSETTGSWSQDGTAGGEIRFQDDGSYTITAYGSPADPEGDGYESVKLPQTLWETYTILEGAARDCPPAGRSEVTGTDGPVLGWASAGSLEVEGSIDPLNPPSVIDGSQTLAIDTFPPGTVTVSWHLVHDGPIDVTYNEPPPE